MINVVVVGNSTTYDSTIVSEHVNFGPFEGFEMAEKTGLRKYEYTNHGSTALTTGLGNVLLTTNDKRLYVDNNSDNIIDGYTADMRSYSDYYPYGMPMVGRNSNISDYRFGYQGSEMDNEAKGNGNSYTTYFRQHDPRLGRWMSVDPVTQPWQSPYTSMDDNPILLNDPMGNVAGEFVKEADGTTTKVSDVGDADGVDFTYSGGEWVEGKSGDMNGYVGGDVEVSVQVEKVPGNDMPPPSEAPTGKGNPPGTLDKIKDFGRYLDGKVQGGKDNLNTDHGGDQITGETGMPESQVESFKGKPSGQTDDIIPGQTAGGAKGKVNKKTGGATGKMVKNRSGGVSKAAETGNTVIEKTTADDVNEKVGDRASDAMNEVDLDSIRFYYRIGEPDGDSTSSSWSFPIEDSLRMAEFFKRKPVKVDSTQRH